MSNIYFGFQRLLLLLIPKIRFGGDEIKFIKIKYITDHILVSF